MRRRIGRSVCAATAALVALFGARAEASAAAPGFTMETLAPGVHAFVRTKPPGLFLDSNVLVVVGDDGVVVVDANLTPSSAEATIAAIRRLTSKPVCHLVNTHRHHDHVGGNEVYRREFPAIEIVGHAAMREDLERHGEATMNGWTGWAAEMTKQIPPMLESGKGFAGQTLSAEERASYAADLEAARELVADTPRMRVVPPTLVVTERFVLRQSTGSTARTIEIVAPGKGHTRGDLAVWLPAEQILATGDLLVAPVPLVGADQSYVEEWIETLERLRILGATTYVPGHGAVRRDDRQLVLYRDFLAAVRDQTKAAMANGSSAEQAAAALDLASFRDRMAGDSPVLRFLFATWGRVPAVHALYRARDEAKAAQP
jgi:cyclase